VSSYGRVEVSSVSPAAGRRSLFLSAASLIEKETLKKSELRIMNIEYRISKEGIRSILKKTEQSETSLRNLSALSGICGPVVDLAEFVEGCCAKVRSGNPDT
jgi:hypothetical protein